MEFLDKVFVVTGGANGMGRELVLQLLDRGARVAAVDINEKALAETIKLAKDNKDKLSIHVVNITDKAAVEALPEEVMKKHKVIDGIINNAGIIQPFIKVDELDYDTIHRVMDINFYGTLFMVKSFLPHLKKRPIATIANVSSMGGFLPVPGQSIYGASKAAVKLLTEGLHSELLGTNVRVSIIFPGGVATDIMKNSGVETTRKKETSKKQKAYKMTPVDVAAKIMLDGIANEKPRILVGKDAKFMDKFTRINPVKAAALIAKKL
jgi:NADP-dependent 3-hydroxy acid dehydrogenase YdfG